MHNTMNGEKGANTGWIISGVAIGTGIVLAYAASRRKKDWRDRLLDTADNVSRKREDLAETGRNLLERIRLIYDESRKVVEDASELWSHGRRLVRW